MVLVIMVLAVTMLTKVHYLCRGLTVASTFSTTGPARNDQSTTRAEAAAPRRSDLPHPLSFEGCALDDLESKGLPGRADLSYVRAPRHSRRATPRRRSEERRVGHYPISGRPA